MHGDRVKAKAMIDDDAVAFEVEWPREHDHPAVGGPHSGARRCAKIHALVNAGELSVEGATRTEAVGRWSFDWRAERAGPERSVGACGEDFFFDLAVGFDFFHLVGAGAHELRLHRENAGAVVRRMDLDCMG